MEYLKCFSFLLISILLSFLNPGSLEAQQDKQSNEKKKQEEPAIADTNELIFRGLEVYRQQYCGTCHRFKRTEASGIFGPSHDNFIVIVGQRIQADTYTGNATTPAGYIRESIVDPDAYIVPGYSSGWYRMPPYRDLAPEDIEALVQLLLSKDEITE